MVKAKAKAKSPRKFQHLGLKRLLLLKWIKRKKQINLRRPMILRDNEEFEEDFSTWLKDLLAKIKPLVSFQPFGALETCEFLHDSIKKHIWSFTCCFYDVKKAGYCVSSKALKRNNLVVVHGVIKFRHLYLLKFSQTRAEKTFRKLRKCILKWFFPHKIPAELPCELQNLLTLLDNGACEKQLLVRHHICFMSDMSIMNFVSSWNNVRPQLNKGQYKRYGRACAALPNNDTWKGAIATNLEFVDALNKSKYNGSKFDQPRFSRNSMQHILTNCWRGIKKVGHKRGSSSSQPNFTLREVVKMIMTYFSQSLSVMPDLLNENMLLQLYCPQQYFT